MKFAEPPLPSFPRKRESKNGTEKTSPLPVFSRTVPDSRVSGNDGKKDAGNDCSGADGKDGGYGQLPD